MRDPLNIVPRHIRERHERLEFVQRGVKAAKSLEGELKSAFGDEVDLCFIRHDIRPDALPENAVAGRWHVRRHNRPPEMPSYIPITTPNGGYREPSSRIIPELAEIDLRRPGVKQRMMERARTDAPHKRRERELKREQRLDVAKEDYRAARRVRGEGGLTRSFEGQRKAKA